MNPNLFEIYPHKGYLNSEVVLYNKNKFELIIRNITNRETYQLNPGMSLSQKFTAGEVCFECEYNGQVQKESIFIEDALRLGGSMLKNTFIFDENPWIVVTKKDRTYFYNRDTYEQLVENGLTPDNITHIYLDYLLFNSHEGYSIFSTNSMKLIQNFTGFLFNKYNFLVYKTLNGFGIFYMLSNKVDKVEIDCNSFHLDKKSLTIYYHTKDKENTIFIKELETNKDSKYNFEGSFISFISDNFFIVSSDENRLVKLFEIKSNNAIDILKEDFPISIINDKVLQISYQDRIEKNDYKLIKHEVKIEVLRAGHNFYVFIDKMLETIDPNGNYKSNKDLYYKTISKCYKKTHKYKSVLKVEDGILITNISNQKIYISQDHIYSIYGDIYYDFQGKVIISEKKEKGDNNLIKLTRLNKEVIGNGLFNFHKCKVSDTGFIYNEENHQYLRISDKKYYKLDEAPERINNYVIVKEKASQPQFITGNNNLYYCPCPVNDILNISASDKYIVFNEGANIRLAQNIDMKWIYKDDYILDNLNNLDSYSYAVFDGDSKYIFYRKKDGSYCMYNLLNKEELFFSNENFIEKNINGYRPFVKFEHFRRPVLIDPITLRNIDSDFLCNYRFFSPDSTLFADNNTYIEYINEVTNEIIDKNKLRELQEKYNYSKTITVELEKEREKLFGSHAEFFIQKIIFFFKNWKDDDFWNSKRSNHKYFLTLFNTIPDVISLMVKTNEIITINENNKQIKIAIGQRLWFLNYIPFSYDSKYVLISGRYHDDTYSIGGELLGGLHLLYDLEKNIEVYRTEQTKAVWQGVFNKNGVYAYYTSDPETWFIFNGHQIKIPKRSFLTFSPSGNFFALSRQGYIRSAGHQPSCDIYVHSINNLQNEICHFNDHGDEIEGVATSASTVASVAFSADEKKILSISRDGVIIIRNLNFNPLGN